MKLEWRKLGEIIEDCIASISEMLSELSRREKEAGIKPDHDIDIFMKVSFLLATWSSRERRDNRLVILICFEWTVVQATAMEGQETNIVTDYVLKVGFCKETPLMFLLWIVISGSKLNQC
jgi:hypothetical protein